jgi:hypothetical protein
MTATTEDELITNLADAPQMNADLSIIKSQVDRLFKDVAPCEGQCCRNPVTGGGWLVGVDPIAPQKWIAHRGLFAREWFVFYGPHDAQPLPLSGIEIEDRKYAPGSKNPSLSYIVSCFAYSLGAHGYEVHSHPSFEDFARGVLAAGYAPDFVKQDKLLHKRYPPKRLPDLNAGNCWEPAIRHPDLMASFWKRANGLK